MINLQRTPKEYIYDIRFNILQVFIYYIGKVEFFKECLKTLLGYKGQRSKNYSHLALEVIGIMNCTFGKDVYPFFGTLLSIIRDNKFDFADDFDFATTKLSIISLETISKLEAKGFCFYKFSYIDGIGVVELSFLYKGVNIDIFLLNQDGNDVSHTCPNFRTSIQRREKNTQFEVKKYQEFFKVLYPSFELTFNEHWSTWLPKGSERIFELHYGDDWRIPKDKKFIDFKNYDFIKGKSFSFQSKPDNNEKIKDIIKEHLI